MKIRLAQTPFLSVQGEGVRTGKLTIFVRFFGCNLRCAGFFQDHPTKPETYIKPITVDPKTFKTLDDFPVVKYGCDTLYAIDPQYKHLAIDYANASELLEHIESLLPKSDGVPSWFNRATGNSYDICFTGGEPLLHQKAINQVLLEIDKREPICKSVPASVQFETNGTQVLSDELRETLLMFNKVTFNVSPKLFNVTGEGSGAADGWNTTAIKSLQSPYHTTYLKVVLNDKIEAFDELDAKVKEMSTHTDIQVYVMPVGSTFEQQTDYDTINKISLMALNRGYHISGRLHCNLFGNDSTR